MPRVLVCRCADCGEPAIAFDWDTGAWACATHWTQRSCTFHCCSGEPGDCRCAQCGRVVCWECGTETASGGKYCQGCGVQVADVESKRHLNHDWRPVREASSRAQVFRGVPEYQPGDAVARLESDPEQVKRIAALIRGADLDPRNPVPEPEDL